MGAAARMIDEDNRWFAPVDREAPREKFDDITMVTEVSVSDIEIVEDLPTVLSTSAQRTTTPVPTGGRRDDRFEDLNAIVEETRAILRGIGMTDAQLDSVEWQLRERIAKR